MNFFNTRAASVFVLVLAPSLLWLSHSQGQPATETPQAKKVIDEKAIRDLIAALGDDSFEKREAAEKGLASAMSAGAQRADQVRLAGARLAVEEQDARLARGAAPGGHRFEQGLEFLARLGVDDLDIDGVGAPDVVLPGDGMLERGREPVGMLRYV